MGAHALRWRKETPVRKGRKCDFCGVGLLLERLDGDVSFEQWNTGVIQWQHAHLCIYNSWSCYVSVCTAPDMSEPNARKPQ